MYKYLLISAMALLVMTSCDQSVRGSNGVIYESAAEYNDFIVSRQGVLIGYILEFSRIADIDFDSAESRLKEYSKHAGQIIGEIRSMPPYKGDSALRDAAARSFEFYQKIFEQDYREILDLKKKGTEFAVNEKNTANMIFEKIRKEEELFDKNFYDAQQRFADKNNMKLKENRLKKKKE